ncbi:MAG: hypothetical protein D6748_00815 [Calditrichaeota bacterium]|nr:MAG: hypothetical protein D6748_00815 [Calditrichota bacterium]
MKVNPTSKYLFSQLNIAQKEGVQSQNSIPEKAGKVDKSTPEQNTAGVKSPKKILPEDFQALQQISRQEQAFFEKLYPNARKEIRVYLEQQQRTFKEKGQIVDLKG